MSEQAKMPESATSHRATAREVIDWTSWLMHVDYVLSMCDSTTTAFAAFRIFKQSASAKRGSRLTGIKTYG